MPRFAAMAGAYRDTINVMTAVMRHKIKAVPKVMYCCPPLAELIAAEGSIGAAAAVAWPEGWSLCVLDGFCMITI